MTSPIRAEHHSLASGKRLSPRSSPCLALPILAGTPRNAPIPAIAGISSASGRVRRSGTPAPIPAPAIRCGRRRLGFRANGLSPALRSRTCAANPPARIEELWTTRRSLRSISFSPAPSVAPHFMGGQGRAFGLHRAQTFRFPLVADKSAASALHPAL